MNLHKSHLNFFHNIYYNKLAMNKVIKDFRSLCTPASIYFTISMVFFVIAVVQNLGNTSNYCLGKFSCYVNNTTGVFVLKLLYILFFTWLLNVFCKAGYKRLSWFLLLLPYVMMFVLIGFMMYNAM